jgi:hypothetical protein
MADRKLKRPPNRQVRRRRDQSAWITFDGETINRECRVSDVSRNDVKLIVPDHRASVNRLGTLLVPRAAKRQCEVVWRRRKRSASGSLVNHHVPTAVLFDQPILVVEVERGGSELTRSTDIKLNERHSFAASRKSASVAGLGVVEREIFHGDGLEQ